MSKYNVGGYTYGSLAYDLPSKEVENKYDIRVEKTRGLSKKKPVPVFKFLMIGAVIFGLVFSILAQSANIMYSRNKMSNIQNEIKLLNDEIYEVDVKIAEALDLTNIKKIARGKLGMVDPEDVQTMFVNVPNENYTINY